MPVGQESPARGMRGWAAMQLLMDVNIDKVSAAATNAGLHKIERIDQYVGMRSSWNLKVK